MKAWAAGLVCAGLSAAAVDSTAQDIGDYARMARCTPDVAQWEAWKSAACTEVIAELARLGTDANLQCGEVLFACDRDGAAVLVAVQTIASPAWRQVWRAEGWAPRLASRSIHLTVEAAIADAVKSLQPRDPSTTIQAAADDPSSKTRTSPSALGIQLGGTMPVGVIARFTIPKTRARTGRLANSYATADVAAGIDPGGFGLAIGVHRNIDPNRAVYVGFGTGFAYRGAFNCSEAGVFACMDAQQTSQVFGYLHAALVYGADTRNKVWIELAPTLNYGAAWYPAGAARIVTWPALSLTVFAPMPW